MIYVNLFLGFQGGAGKTGQLYIAVYILVGYLFSGSDDVNRSL